MSPQPATPDSDSNAGQLVEREQRVSSRSTKGRIPVRYGKQLKAVIIKCLELCLRLTIHGKCRLSIVNFVFFQIIQWFVN